MTRRPRRAEINQARIATANKMRQWLTDCRERAAERNRLDAKQRALLGDDGGGNGVTVEMRRISGEAAARAVEINAGAITSREDRRSRRARRNRADRRWEPSPGPQWGGRYVWPTPPGRTVPYAAPADPGTGDHA